MADPMQEKYRGMIEAFEWPVKYDPVGQMIVDGKQRLVITLRGWAWMQKLDSPIDFQDEVGECIVELLNELADVRPD